MLFSTITELGIEVPGIPIVSWVNIKNESCQGIAFHKPNGAPEDKVLYVKLDPADPPDVIDGRIMQGLIRAGQVRKYTQLDRVDRIWMILIEKATIRNQNTDYKPIRWTNSENTTDGRYLIVFRAGLRLRLIIMGECLYFQF